jgi:acyl transferase domain-containing protein
VTQVLLESAASFGLGPKKTASIEVASESIPQLLAFSAKHLESVKRMAADHESYLISHPESLKDMSYSLTTKREVLPHRAYCIADGDGSFELSRVHKSALKMPPKLVWCFTGQGAQWAQMGKELIENVPSFRASIQGLDDVLAGLPDAPKWKLLGL